MADSLHDQYVHLKRLAKANLADPAITASLVSVTKDGHEFLRTDGKLVPLKSCVPRKEYVSYQVTKALSRPINTSLYIFDPAELDARLAEFTNKPWPSLDGVDLTRTIYTLAMAFCAANDATKTGDKKTPATYFEILIGHIFSRHLGVVPLNSIPVLSGDLKGNLPTDFIFDLGPQLAKFHVPIKLSTRERVIQVWAHQRVVDGVYGVGYYKGVLCCLTETKLDSNSLDVVEICLPDQWRIYQMHIAQLTRIYYLDVPDKYAGLSANFPKIEVQPFGRFFAESSTL